MKEVIALRYRRLGTTGEFLPIVGQGTWKLEQADYEQARRSILSGIDAGMTHLDTAEDYGKGRAEELLGRILLARRDDVFLTSKVHPDHATRAADVRAACHASCRRLGTDRLDLYLLHWPGDASLEECVTAFRSLQQEGAIRHWGVSNFSLQDLDHLARLSPRGEAACNQIFYHLAERRIEHRVLPRGDRMGLSTIAYSPLGSGVFPPPGHPGNPVLERIARCHGASTAQVALAWLARHDSIMLLARSYRPEHTLANAASADLRLTPADVGSLDAAYPAAPYDGLLPTR
ncbi:aldo/keto reductase [Actinomadura macrotermitis]|uniref:Putative oxidoreductase n=1 Tax=Actinomadura macrotermitis TaxID=2585200 RepID=A0A7K0C448_9ACTN|nr:aldo/keto reductase [Actinomadura macrotermitis]MQY08156.1 putative oxidoreductase [Actinomadura macrotermitis]